MDMARENEDVFEGLLPFSKSPAPGNGGDGQKAAASQNGPTMAGFSDRGLLSAITGAVAGAVHAVKGVFKKYEPEPLSSRLADPMVIPSDGRNPAVLCMKVDGNVRNFRLPAATEAALADGSLPITTLANTVLAKIDEGRAKASLNFETEQASIAREGRYVPSMHM